MDKVDIINDFRLWLSPWLLKNFDFFNNISFGAEYQNIYNNLIIYHKNNPDSFYFVNSSQDMLFGNFIINLGFFAILKLL